MHCEYLTQFEISVANTGISSWPHVMVLGPRSFKLSELLRICCLARGQESQFVSAQWRELGMIDAVSAEKYRALFPRKADAIVAYISRQPLIAANCS